MANNDGNSNLYPDWYHQNLNDDLPSDLEDVEPLNPSLPTYHLGPIAGASFAGVEQLSLSNWANDPCVGDEGNSLAVQGGVVYPRTISNRPQHSDLQIADFSHQFGSSSLQVDAALNNSSSSDGSNQVSSLFPMDYLTPLQPSRFDEFYTNEPCNDLTTEYGSFTHGYSDYQQHGLSNPGNNSGTGECRFSYPDFGAPPSHEFAGETSSNSLLPESGTLNSGVDMPSSFGFVGESCNTGVLVEVGPSCSNLSVPSGNACLGDAGNNGTLQGRETSFTLLGAWQPPRDQLNENPGPSSGAVPRRTRPSRFPVSTAEGSSSFPHECGRDSSCARGYSQCHENLAPDNHSQRQKRNRTPKSVYGTMSEEEKLAQKREQGARASKKYWERKRKVEVQNRQEFDTQLSRNSDLQENLTRDQRRVQLMYLALQNMNINPNRSRAVDEEDEDSFEE